MRRSISAFGVLRFLQAVGKILADGHMRVKRVVLEDHGDVALGRLDIVDDALADRIISAA